jgi:glycine oxidase
LRFALGYASGGIDGLCVGATMEPGRTDRVIDPAAVGQLGAAAQAISPALGWAFAIPQAAVRGASPDGLPMVGPSARPGVMLAVGARRNGWLLAPLVARTVAAYVGGRDPGPHAAMLDPRRFS